MPSTLGAHTPLTSEMISEIDSTHLRPDIVKDVLDRHTFSHATAEVFGTLATENLNELKKDLEELCTATQHDLHRVIASDSSSTLPRDQKLLCDMIRDRASRFCLYTFCAAHSLLPDAVPHPLQLSREVWTKSSQAICAATTASIATRRELLDHATQFPDVADDG